MEGIDWKYKIHAVNRATGVVRTDDEAILFLAKDDAVPGMLAFYYDECMKIGAEQGQLDSIKLLQTRVQNWRREHFDQCKTPDMSSAERPIQIEGRLPDAELELYMLAKGGSLRDVTSEVNALMERGYVPHGSMVASQGGAYRFLQPMVLATTFTVESSAGSTSE